MPGTTYEALYACFLSGQMSAAALHEHMAADAVFAAYVRRQTARRSRDGANRAG